MIQTQKNEADETHKFFECSGVEYGKLCNDI